jgi:hypothetical protein
VGKKEEKEEKEKNNSPDGGVVDLFLSVRFPVTVKVAVTASCVQTWPRNGLVMVQPMSCGVNSDSGPDDGCLERINGRSGPVNARVPERLARALRGSSTAVIQQGLVNPNI